MTRYRAVIFDLFGTLVDNFTVAAYEAVLDRIAGILRVPPEDFRRLWAETFEARSTGAHQNQRDSFIHICRELGVDVTSGQLDEAFRLRLDFTAGSLTPRPATVPTLRAVKEQGYRTALISDCSGEVPALWPDTPMNGHFDVTVFSCTAGMKKPDPRIYRMATDALGVAPEDCLYVGDGSSTELTGARNLGMTAVLIIDPGETVDPHYVKREDDWDGQRISWLSEVLDILGEARR